MADVYFCRTDYHYPSYDDFFRLVTLSGYPIIPLSEIDPTDAGKTYIVTPLNGEWLNGWPDAKAQIIHWDLEWRLDREYPRIPGIARTWASDQWYARKVGCQYVLLGSHAGLAGYMTEDIPLWVSIEPQRKSFAYDVCLMMYQGPYRRSYLINKLKLNGLRIAPDGWGFERCQNINSSKAMVHIHQHDSISTVAPLRFALAAAYKIPLISETLQDSGPFNRETVLTFEYDNLPQQVSLWTTQYSERGLYHWGWALNDLLCQDWTFGKCVEAAL